MNQPGYVKHVAEYIAALRGISVDDVAAATTRNFFTLFKDAKRFKEDAKRFKDAKPT